MSYDLFLKPREGDISFPQLAGYFGSRPGYQRGENEFWYHNGDTGVYFSIYFRGADAGADIERPGFPLHFNMEFYRPSFFAFEAEAEVSSLVRKFDLIASDPQALGMGEGDYDGEKFLNGWHSGNGFAYQAAQELKANDEQVNVLTLAQHDLHGMWGWNRNRVRYQKHLGEAYYVPPIWPMKIEGHVTTATMWPDGIPTFIPKAKFLIIPRDKYGPKGGANTKKDMAIIPWEQVEPIIGKYSEKIQDDGYLINSYEQVPADVESFIKELPSSDVHAERVAFDSVLDLELWKSSAAQ